MVMGLAGNSGSRNCLLILLTYITHSVSGVASIKLWRTRKSLLHTNHKG